ncbi:hypothetical protein [Litorivivens sp.]|uniref:hypothetical protein n=1 Tax=Litorivivens sp. TaxID=2020868 RepID=UPI0035664BE3
MSDKYAHALDRFIEVYRDMQTEITRLRADNAKLAADLLTKEAQETGEYGDDELVEEAMYAAETGNANHWPIVASILADEITRLRAQLEQAREALEHVSVCQECAEMGFAACERGGFEAAMILEALRQQKVG